MSSYVSHCTMCARSAVPRAGSSLCLREVLWCDKVWQACPIYFCQYVALASTLLQVLSIAKGWWICVHAKKRSGVACWRPSTCISRAVSWNLKAPVLCPGSQAELLDAGCRYVNIVPTSAISGEGIPDMLKLLVDLTQVRLSLRSSMHALCCPQALFDTPNASAGAPQEMMSGKLMFLSELQCTVLEVKMIEGLGTTVDVVLVNGILREGETVVICGLQGPIVTTIRSLLTPHPLKVGGIFKDRHVAVTFCMLSREAGRWRGADGRAAARRRSSACAVATCTTRRFGRRRA